MSLSLLSEHGEPSRPTQEEPQNPMWGERAMSSNSWKEPVKETMVDVSGLERWLSY